MSQYSVPVCTRVNTCQLHLRATWKLGGVRIQPFEGIFIQQIKLLPDSLRVKHLTEWLRDCGIIHHAGKTPLLVFTNSVILTSKSAVYKIVHYVAAKCSEAKCSVHVMFVLYRSGRGPIRHLSSDKVCNRAFV